MCTLPVSILLIKNLSVYVLKNKIRGCLHAVAAREEFLVFVNRSHIHRYVFDRSRDELVPVSGPTNILAVDYDYANDCVFWSDAQLYNIQVNKWRFNF